MRSSLWHPCRDPSFIPSASPSFPGVACFSVLTARPRFYGLVRIGGCDEPPRPSLMPTRESRRLVTVRDAFYRQGLFLGSGGLYSPGPTTGSPLLAMFRPLSGTLAPPWASSGPLPIHIREWGRSADVPFARRTRRWFHPPTFTSS